VCTLPTEAAGRLGADFLEIVGTTISFESCELSFAHDKCEPRTRDDAHEDRMSHTVFIEGEEGRSPRLRLQEARQTDEPPQAVTHCVAPTP
jgi:hypothetical protein